MVAKIVSFLFSIGHYLLSILDKFEKHFDEKEDDLDSTENGESSEETHRASNHAQGRLKSNLEIYNLQKLEHYTRTKHIQSIIKFNSSVTFTSLSISSKVAVSK